MLFTVANVGIPMLSDELETIVIPEISGDKHHIHYEFKKFVTNIDISVHVSIMYFCYL